MSEEERVEAAYEELMESIDTEMGRDFASIGRLMGKISFCREAEQHFRDERLSAEALVKPLVEKYSVKEGED